MAKKKKYKSQDKFEVITNRLIELIESGKELPWERPWQKLEFCNLFNQDKPYSGINPYICATDTAYFGYGSNYFVGVSQAKEKGWQIKKGSKATWLRWGGTRVVEEKKVNDKGETVTETEYRNSYKWLKVFNLDCFDDRDSERKIIDFMPQSKTNSKPFESNNTLEKLFDAIGAEIRYGGNRAYYTQDRDYIQLPPRKVFSCEDAFYLVASHEHIHWTRHPSRLNRQYNPKQSQEDNYAFEELVAELGAAYFRQEFKLEAIKLENHASYLAGYLNVLKGDRKAFFRAASLARTAVEWLLEPDNQTDQASGNSTTLVKTPSLLG